MRAYLVFEDGSIYEGTARGAFRETACEVVFNTSMTGYFEILSDPSYAGQGIVMTYPLIGNYGISFEDLESIRLQPNAFIVRELCGEPSNFRSVATLEEVLVQFGVPCLSDIDTRSVVKKLRESGTMLGLLTQDISSMKRCMDVISKYRHVQLVERVSVKESKTLGDGNTGPSVAVYDFDEKMNITHSLLQRNCRITTYPFYTTAKEILDGGHDGIMLSNGPGDPAECKGIIKELGTLYEHGMPTFAICLGHQLMALATGGNTEKMKYGHRGSNHPVKFLAKDKTYITAQNHGYVVCREGLPQNAEIHCVNINDNSVEGVLYRGKPVFSVQFHPEASAGPRDTAFLFDRFIDMMREGRYVD
mgnify:CR=1 FL=1